jgi:hypothetical protein
MQEVFRYAKAHRTRSYGLKPIDEHRVELWVMASDRGRLTASRRLVTLSGDAETTRFLDAVRQELRLGGWSVAGPTD